MYQISVAGCLASLVGTLLSAGCGETTYLVNQQTLLRAAAQTDRDTVAVPAVVDDEDREKVTLRYSSVDVVSAERASPPPNGLVRVRGEVIPASPWDQGARGNAIAGATMVGAGIVAAAAILGGTMPCSGGGCGLTQAFGGGIAGLVGLGAIIPGSILLASGLGQHSRQEAIIEQSKSLRLVSLRWTPYATTNGAGLVAGAQF
jgi:hypothetical protein